MRTPRRAGPGPARKRCPPGRLSLPRTAGKPCRRPPVFRARHQPWRAQRTTQSCAGHVSSRPYEGEAARSGGLPGRGSSRAPEGRQVNPAAGDSAGTEGQRTCPAGDCPPAPPVPLARGQDFLARPHARPRDNDTAPRATDGPSWTCRRPAVDHTPPRHAGCAGQISLSPAHPRGESHSPMEGSQIEGGPTPYPHIALCATALKSISSRRTGCMASDMQKRCTEPRSAAGWKSLSSQNLA